MTFEENLQRKENGVIFAPNYGNFRTNILNSGARNLTELKYSYFTKGGITTKQC